MVQFLVVDSCAIIHLMYINSFSLLANLGYSPITTTLVKREFKKSLDKGHPESYNFFNSLEKENKISIVPLEIEDLVEMNKIEPSKKIDNEELSCVVLAKRLGGKVMTDDETAVKYLKSCGYLDSPSSLIVTLIDVLLDAHYNYFINEYDLQRMQSTLTKNDFIIKTDLVQEATRRRLMRNFDNSLE